jgi:hypothetical protein
MLEFRAKDMTAIRKPPGCVGLIGNNLLRQYAAYFNPDSVLHFPVGKTGTGKCRTGK